MEVGKLNVSQRTATGSSAARKLRQKGQIPAVCYGGEGEPILLALDPSLLLKSLDPQKRTNTVIEMSVDGQKINVMLRDWQRDAIRGNVTHADFVRVDLNKDVHAVVPVVLTGKPEGVKLGGTLHQVIRQLAIACKPDRIPVQLEINVDALNMGEAIHVRDLPLGEGVRALVDGGQTICTVTAPRAEKVAAPTEAEAAAAAAAPAEGAAAAPAAEGGEKKAAAPAKGGGEKAAPAKEKK